MVVPDPPYPFDPEPFELATGQELYRVHGKDRDGHAFNPGMGTPTRFAFFGDPVVPILYAAETWQAAIAESLLHDVPVTGGQLTASAYANRRMSRLRTTRGLRVASFMGLGLRKLGVTADQVTTTPAAEYDRTVLWAEAARRAGYDGVAYMSNKCNSDRAYAFFADRCQDAFEPDPAFRWNFSDPIDGRPALITFCSRFGVEVLIR
ncbi:RES family NAD+ phosphorylase [Leifsonia sp. ZF2019]|uniref:RES family NAD+ phosphorylase n=1 Tax=Leifsonia sp. ZF2019 TaxID=2781978 RepID=UPI001CBDEFAB|nr:RES family NAD+ phosphorylase [Leifsonia sp. ZF2019]UAJ80068.1 RES family NAD+ phosphorylase [Leifsonia sp. ZF2019]